MKLFYHKIYCKKRSIALLLALTLCLAVVLGGCKKEEEPQPPPEPEDPNFPVELNLREKTVTIGEKPTAVVSLSPAITNTLLDMGMEEALAGVSQYCLSLPGAQGLQNCGTAQNVDLEAVKALAPQILFTDTPLLSQQLTALYQMNVEVVEITRPESIGAIEERQLLLAQALYGKEEGFQRGRAYQKQYHSRWEDIMEPLARWSQENNSLTAILLAYSNTTMATGDTFEGSLLEQMGFINLGNSGFNWQYQPKEGESLSPEIIFYNSALEEEAIAASEFYKESPAVAQGRLYPVEWQNIHLQGENMLKELEAMARECYPEAFTASEENSVEDTQPSGDDAPPQETEQEEGDAPQEE